LTSSPSQGQRFQLLRGGSELRFTLRRDLCGRLSACADGPSGRDVDCRVHIRLRLMSAGCAPEDRLALTVLRCAMPADATGLRRVRGADLLDPARSLVLQTSYQRAPAVGQDAPIETGFRASTVRQVPTCSRGIGLGPRALGHPNDAQVFSADDIEPPRKVGAGLLHPVSSTVGGSRVQFGNRSLHAPTTMGTAMAAG